MRLLKAGLLLLCLGGLCATTLHAFEPGDFAPRGSLLYARANDLSGGLGRLGGDAWKDQAERMLLARSRHDVEDSEPIINEIRRFVDFLGTTEFVISDVMVREPYVQMALVAQLKEGAPTEFSEEFIKFMKEENSKAEVTKTSLKFENGSLWLKGGVIVLSSGGMMDAHVQDVIEGYTDESLSKVERFTKWSAKAKGDIVLFADMKAWRTAVDRLGEDFDRELKYALETVEWQKWDLITGSVTLPGKTTSLSVDLSLSVNQPFEHVNAFLKPAGGSKLVDLLPAETVGFLTMQLGRNHQRTYDDLLHFFHDAEQNERPTRLKRRLEWAEDDVRWAEERLKELKDEGKDGNDKDATPNPDPQSTEPSPPIAEPGDGEEYDPIKEAEEEVARAKQRVAELQEQIAKFKYRAFQPNPEERQGEETEAEGFSDGFQEAIERFGFTREEVLGAIGQEVMLGILDLPDPGFDGNDPGDAYGELWFALVQTQDTFPELKERFLDRMLARKLPADMSEEEKEHAKRQADKTMFKKVEGGEILRGKGLNADFCVFAGEGFVGIAPNEEVALRIMKAGLGQKRMDTSNVPGGLVGGSKFAYLNLRDFLGKIASGNVNRHRRRSEFPSPYFELEKYLPAGFHITLSTDESSQGVLFSLRTAGEQDVSGALEMFADQIAEQKASRHDETELWALRDAIDNWYTDNRDALAKMEAAERTKTLKAVTPEALIASGAYTAPDGLRSAFDPAMAERFQKMLEDHVGLLGAGEDSEDKPSDLSESSFEWFGLPPNIGGDVQDPYSRGDSPIGGTVICAMKGDWAHGGRYVMTWDVGPQIVWFSADDYNALLEANRNGKEYRPVSPAEVNPPKWRVRTLMRRQQYQMQNLQNQVERARSMAEVEGRKFELNFKGSDHEDALKDLRELLGLSEDDWFYFDGAKNLTVKTDTEGKMTARFENWGQWIEIDNDGNITSSYDE
ncbi:MAG: hypothetical protein KDB82_09280 [Planctomycetes bacterium]|nr:hypothetical protein [Planctomycetota bacterium]